MGIYYYYRSNGTSLSAIFYVAWSAKLIAASVTGYLNFSHKYFPTLTPCVAIKGNAVDIIVPKSSTLADTKSAS